VRTPGLGAIVALGAPGADRGRHSPDIESRVERWLASATSGRPELAADMLDALGWTRQSLARTLGEPDFDLDHPPAWALALDDFLQALPEHAGDVNPLASPGSKEVSEWRPDPANDPLLSIWNCTLIAGLKLLPPGPARVGLSDAARTDLAVSLVGRVLACVVRALEPELVVARALDLAPGEALHGDRGSWLERLEDLPGLAHPLGMAVQHWRESTVEMLKRLDADIDQLARRLWQGRCPQFVMRFSPDAGDPHQGGRSVCLIRFEGEDRVVYKPKPQAGSAAWQQLLRWCGEQPALRAAGVELGTREIVDLGDYGWDQTLAKDSADDVDAGAAARWLRSYGALVRLLEVVEAADMWFDNLLTSGGLPQFIDVETVLQPQVAGMSEAATRLAETTAPSGAVSMRLALPDGTLEDIGGLRPVSAVSLPFTERVIGTLSTRTDGYGADGMMRWTPPRWRPDFPDGIDVGAGLLIGYDAVDAALAAEPDRPVSIVARLACTPCRVVLRSTFTCYIVTRETLRPEVLGSGIDREIALAQLLSPGAQALATAVTNDDVTRAHRLLYVGAADRSAISRLDIPLVRHDPCGEAIVLDDGMRYEGWYRASPLERAIARIRDRGDTDVRRRVLVALSTAATMAGGHTAEEAQLAAWCQVVDVLIESGVAASEAREAIAAMRA